MNTVVFVVGPPGVGKTTAIRPLIEIDSELIQKPKWTVGPKVVAAGHYTGSTFDGADTVPYNGVKQALQYWGDNLSTKELTIFDGDRFSYGGVVDWFSHFGAIRMCAIYLGASEDVLNARRIARGSTQSEAWMKGRITKANRFFETFADRKLILADEDKAVVSSRVSEFMFRSIHG